MNEILARTLCICVGITPVDPIDGSPNWWMFNEDAEKIIADLRKRFPDHSIFEFGPEYGPYEN